MTEHPDYARVFRESAPALWRALYGFTGGRRQVAEDALWEAFAPYSPTAETRILD